MTRSAATAFCLVVGLAGPAIRVVPARAQAAVPAEASAEQARDQAAEREYRRGSELYAARSLPEAIAAFTASYRLAPSANVAFNIAQTCELLGRIEDAFNWFQVAASFPKARIAGSAAERVNALAAQVAVLNVELHPSTARLAVDGSTRAVSGLASPQLGVAPGQHRLSAQAPGYAAVESTIEVARGQLLPVTLELTPEADLLAVPSVPAAAQPRPSRSAGVALQLARRPVAPPARGIGGWRWVGYGAAGAGLAVGATLGIVALDKHAAVQADPTHDGRPELRHLNLAADLTVTGALVIAATTLVLDLVFDGAASERPPEHVAEQARR